MSPSLKKTLSYGAYAAALAALLGVFALYTRPEMMVRVSDMIWACFSPG